MNRQGASFFFRPRVVSCSPVPPNKAMQTGGRFAAAADRQGVRRLLEPLSIMKRSHHLLFLLAIVPNSGCAVFDWFYYRELREVEDMLRGLPSVSEVSADGNEDVTLEDIWARVRLDGGGEFVFLALTRDSLEDGAAVTIQRLDDISPRVAGYGHFNSYETVTGRPVKSRFWGGSPGFGHGQPFAHLLHSPIANVADAIRRYHELKAALDAWPHCPDCAVFECDNGTQYRYCANHGSHPYKSPAPDPGRR